MRRLSILVLFLASSATFGQGYLVVPDWSNQHRAVAFDPHDGHLVDESFIDDIRGTNTGFFQVEEVVDSGLGTLVVADAIAGDLYEYSYGGAYLRTIADSGINPHRVGVHRGGIYSHLDTEGDYGRVDVSTGAVAHFASVGSTFYGDVHFRDTDVLIGVKDRILRFGQDGSAMGVFYQGNASIDWLQQISPDVGGGVLAVNRRGTNEFVDQIDANGVFVKRWGTGLSAVGVYRLGNGNLLVSRGIDVVVVDAQNNSISVVLRNGTFGGVNLIAVPEPCTFVATGALVLFVLRRRRVR